MTLSNSVGNRSEDMSGFSQDPSYPWQGLPVEVPAAPVFHSEISNGFSHTGRVDLFLQLAVSHRERLLADPGEGPWISPGGLGNQGNSPRGEDS